jgi:hypothetical protein
MNFGYVTVNRANSNDPGVDNYQKTLNIVHKYVILFQSIFSKTSKFI